MISGLEGLLSIQIRPAWGSAFTDAGSEKSQPGARAADRASAARGNSVRPSKNLGPQPFFQELGHVVPHDEDHETDQEDESGLLEKHVGLDPHPPPQDPLHETERDLSPV